MQSRVLAFGVFRSHSITIRSSNSPTGVPPDNPPIVPFRFFGFGPFVAVAFAVPVPSSLALRFWLAEGAATGGLLALLPGFDRGTAGGVVIIPGVRSFGLVARFATTE